MWLLFLSGVVILGILGVFARSYYEKKKVCNPADLFEIIEEI